MRPAAARPRDGGGEAEGRRCRGPPCQCPLRHRTSSPAGHLGARIASRAPGPSARDASRDAPPRFAATGARRKPPALGRVSRERGRGGADAAVGPLPGGYTAGEAWTGEAWGEPTRPDRNPAIRTSQRAPENAYPGSVFLRNRFATGPVSFTQFTDRLLAFSELARYSSRASLASSCSRDSYCSRNLNLIVLATGG